jgi:hypothetical protein
MFIRSPRLAALVVVCCILCRIGVSRAQESAEATADAILAAWDSWTKSLEAIPYQYECDLEYSERKHKHKAKPDAYDAPELDSQSDEVVTTRQTLAVKRDGPKLAIDFSGQIVGRTNGKVMNQEIRLSFDGDEYRHWIDNNAVSSGLGDFGKLGVPIERLVWIQAHPTIDWRQPSLLVEIYGGDAPRVTLAREKQRIGETECFELEVQPDKSEGIISFFVQPQPPYLPLKVVYGRTGKDAPMLQFDFEYKLHPVVSQQLAYGAITHLDEYGNAIWQQTCRTRGFETGVMFTDNDFKLAFPVGTHLIEKIGGRYGGPERYWIQATPDRLEPLTEDEYGDPETPRKRTRPEL